MRDKSLCLFGTNGTRVHIVYDIVGTIRLLDYSGL